MNTITPNLTALVGKLVGARLIAYGGSFLNLVKMPGSTGKISRSLAAKTALAIMEDALRHGQHNSIGLENRAKLEARLRSLEGNELGRLVGSTKGKPKIESYDKDWKKEVGGFLHFLSPHGASMDKEMQELLVAEEKKEKKKKKKERNGDDDAALQADAGKESD
ncbi:probable nucleolar protein 5-1 [Prosopis cineraria]|uniref:probable nucleolar protein 5-1 n=1 Tax=Prosopis cineraria TaxID=364024 RepID=UPI00240F0738|nr:probable nucleolar protein 5-1 [Prosopis cineraria]